MNEREADITWLNRAIRRRKKIEEICTVVYCGSELIQHAFPANPVVQTIFEIPKIATPIVGVSSMIGHIQYSINRRLLRKNQQPPQ